MSFAAELRTLDEHLGSCVDALDVATLSGEDATVLMRLFASIERRATALKLACGRRAVAASIPHATGARDDASWLARETGVSVGDAKSSLGLAERLEDLPSVGEAFAQGTISIAQAQEIAEASWANPQVADQLLELATGPASFVGLKRACREVKAQTAEDETSRHEALRGRRYFRSWIDGDGMVNGSFRLLPEDGALVLSRLKPFVEKAFRNSNEGSATYEQRAADGFAVLIETSGGPSRRAKVEVVVIASYEALSRGYAVDGERCEIEGVGSIPVALAESLRNDCYLSQIVTREGKPAIIRGKGHYIPDRLRLAVRMRDRCCVVPGCESTFRLEVDHVVPVADGGQTEIDNLQLLCKAHHDQKTYRGFSIVHEGASRSWIPPQATIWSEPPGETLLTPSKQEVG